MLCSLVILFYSDFRILNVYIVNVFRDVSLYIIGYIGYLIYVFNTCLGSVCSKRCEPPIEGGHICRDDGSMVTTGQISKAGGCESHGINVLKRLDSRDRSNQTFNPSKNT